MYLSIRALAFTCLVGLSLILQTDAACGGSGQMEFNTPGTGFQAGEDGELGSAVKCILHQQNCVTNVNNQEVYPAAARGRFEGDTAKLIAYYGPSISNWCVGLVEDFTAVFQGEVSKDWRVSDARRSSLYLTLLSSHHRTPSTIL
jgi:hypothetical protein